VTSARCLGRETDLSFLLALLVEPRREPPRVGALPAGQVTVGEQGRVTDRSVVDGIGVGAIGVGDDGEHVEVEGIVVKQRHGAPLRFDIARGQHMFFGLPCCDVPSQQPGVQFAEAVLRDGVLVAVVPEDGIDVELARGRVNGGGADPDRTLRVDLEFVVKIRVVAAPSTDVVVASRCTVPLVRCGAVRIGGGLDDVAMVDRVACRAHVVPRRVGL
jgi:hypothetical protein